MSDRPLRGGIIGFGYIASQGHLPAYLRRPQRFTIDAVADLCPARADAARAALPNARVYGSHRALLEAEAGRLDFVDICTPPAVHAPIAVDALSLGLHVLCEKPLTTSVAEAQRMVRAARWARRVLYPGHNYRHAPVVKTLQGLLANGSLGQPRLATITTFRTGHAKGTAEWDPDWRRRKVHAGGGIAFDHGAHSLYLSMLLFGERPTHVAALTRSSDPAFADTEDYVTAQLRFPSGPLQITLAWIAGLRKVIYSLHGTRGAAVIDDDSLQLQRHGRLELSEIRSDFNDASHHSWFDSLFGEFAAAIDADDHVPEQLVEACLCVQLITQIYASAAQGGIELPVEPLAL